LSFCSTKISSVPINAIVVGALNPDVISVTDKLGSVRLGAPRAGEYAESQTANRTRNLFIQATS
jgi:hypothetical protein